MPLEWEYNGVRFRAEYGVLRSSKDGVAWVITSFQFQNCFATAYNHTEQEKERAASLEGFEKERAEYFINLALAAKTSGVSFV